jgi:hypothetical protein
MVPSRSILSSPCVGCFTEIGSVLNFLPSNIQDSRQDELTGRYVKVYSFGPK